MAMIMMMITTMTNMTMSMTGEIYGIRFLRLSWEWHEIIEIGTVLGLVIGVIVSFEFQRSLMRRNAKIEDQLLLARGEFGALLASRFEHWGLTAAEQDVAMMAIKGFSIAEVSKMRGTSEGTIKAQNASIYRKAGVTGRNPLLVSLVEDLIDVGVEEKNEIE